jgi:hypothetical protein
MLYLIYIFEKCININNLDLEHPFDLKYEDIVSVPPFLVGLLLGGARVNNVQQLLHGFVD